MSGAFRLGQVFGIPVRVHWTLLLLGALVGLTQGAGAIGTLLGAVLLFASVVAHELAHALVARGFGIETRDIVLTPIGGVARLEGMPERGRAEVAIALAGPLASLGIAGVSFGALSLGAALPVVGKSLLALSLLSTLAWTNAMLGLFNMLPAFPMDGGRVLRGVLRERIGLVRATGIAATIGRLAAVAMGIVGLFTTNVSLVLVAFFVWSASGRERAQVEEEELAREAWRRMPRAWDALGREIHVELVPALPRRVVVRAR